MAAAHSVDPALWLAILDELMGRIAGRFGRVEPRRRARAFVLGLVADLPRKNCWSIAEYAGDATPDGCSTCSRVPAHWPAPSRSGGSGAWHPCSPRR